MRQVTWGVPATISLLPHPTSAGAARRHVVQVLEDGPLSHLVDTATLLVSEVVTNALLHAATDIEVSCRVADAAVHIEVRDRSTVAPSPRRYDASAATGRGLGMVELLADEWGVDVDGAGKVVWFKLGSHDVEPVASRTAPADRVVPPATFEVHLDNLPVELVRATIQYGDALLRELVLLSIGQATGGGGGPVSKIDLGPLLARLDEAHDAGRSCLDLVLAFPAGSGSAALERLALVDEADRMARDGELLTIAAVPEVGSCRRWLFGQIALQEDGQAPVPWRMPETLEPVVTAPRLPDEELRRLDALAQATLLADDANRILHVTREAADLLGWEVDELVGRRLVTIVPTELRAAHLAGFTRHLLTGEARFLGRQVRLPALRRDGSSVEVGITIEVVDLGPRRVFRATLS